MVDLCQASEVVFFGQQICLERLQSRSPRRTALPDLLPTNKPQRGVLGEALRVVHVFISCQTAVHRLPQQVSQRQPGVLPPRVGQVLLGKFTESQTFVYLPHQNQAAIGSDSRSLEIDLQGSIEEELKGMVLFLTHWVCTSKASSPRPNPHKYRCQRTPEGS